MVALLGPGPRCGYVRGFGGRTSVNVVLAFGSHDPAFDVVADFGGDGVEEVFVSVDGYG